MKSSWPKNSTEPFGIKSDFSWNDLGAIFRIVGENKIQLIVETGVGRGDLAAWMIAKSWFDPDFDYLGITPDPTSVDARVIDNLTLSGRSFIAVGAPCGAVMLDRVRRLIKNSSSAMVICDGIEIDREVDHYLPLLRSGDVIVAHRFLEVYSGRRLMDMDRNEQLKRITGDWMNRTGLIAGVVV